MEIKKKHITLKVADIRYISKSLNGQLYDGTILEYVNLSNYDKIRVIE